MNLPDSDSEDELPPGWEERVTVDGSVFYANHVTKATQWNHPRTGKRKRVSGQLPYGWERCVDKEDGRVLYVDHENRRTTYTDPRLAFAVEEKEHPHDYRQRFDGSSTALQVLHGLDLSGKTAIITGASVGGIGYETARSLVMHGCRVLVASRTMSQALRTCAALCASKQGVESHAIALDLEHLASVKVACEKIRTLCSHGIDMLILNAGLFGVDFELTPDQYERIFQVNHLGHLYMTLLLVDLLDSGARVVVVSSESHRFANFTKGATVTSELLSPSCKATSHWPIVAYNNAKLCNILMMQVLARSLQTSGVCVLAVHPGNLVSTNLTRHSCLYRLLYGLVRPFTKSLQQAAATTIYCACAPDLVGVTGAYFNNCCRCNESSAAKSYELAIDVWRVSCNMIQAVQPDFDAAKWAQWSTIS